MNATEDVFTRDLREHRTRLESVGRDGWPADNSSFAAALSCDGDTVGFHSFGSNLVPNDTNGLLDVFARTR